MRLTHYNDVVIGAMTSQISSLTIVCSTIYSCADQIKHQSFASLAFLREIHRWPVNSPHKGPATWKMFRFLMTSSCYRDGEQSSIVSKIILQILEFTTSRKLISPTVIKHYQGDTPLMLKHSMTSSNIAGLDGMIRGLTWSHSLIPQTLRKLLSKLSELDVCRRLRDMWTERVQFGAM